MTEMFTMIGARRLAYWRSGAPAADSAPASRRTVLLLHGLGADHQGLLPLTRAWPNVEVIAPDLPGFGRSSQLSVEHSMTSYASAVDALCARLDLSDLTVIGHSLGASIALAFAAMYPARVGALVLISPVTSGDGPRTFLASAYYGIGSVLPARAARVWFLSRPAVYLADCAVLVTADRHVRRRILDDDYRTAALASPRAIADIYHSVRDTSFATLAGAVPAPTLLIAGERDKLAAPSTLAVLGGHFPRSEFVVIPNAGHLWPAEEPSAAGHVIDASLCTLAGSAYAMGGHSAAATVPGRSAGATQPLSKAPASIAPMGVRGRVEVGCAYCRVGVSG